MSIFDLMTSQELAAYWEVLLQDEAPYPCEELFPDDKKLGLDLKWIKGSKGLPVVLKTSAFDAKAIPRPRIGFTRLSASMPFFKESTYIDEELRQELNKVIETGNQAYIDSVMNQVFDDEVRLLRGARASRERMRMMALTTGMVAMAANGQSYSFDYNVEHKSNVTVAWTNYETADPIEDMRAAKEEIRDDTGAVVTRAMCDGVTMRHMRKCKSVIKAIYPISDGAGAVSEKQLLQYIQDELDIQVLVNDMRYIDENENSMKFMPADTMVMFPGGNLGKTWFGTTPEESDLMASSVDNVTIVETGVAVTTMLQSDPVNVETKVTMICLPSFEAADQVYILSTVTE